MYAIFHLSLFKLDKKGYKFTEQGGVIRTAKSEMTVMKGIQARNFYKLLKSMMMDKAYAIENNDLPLRLWHRRLNYMSEKGIKILVERNLILSITFGDSKSYEHYIYRKHHK